MNNSDDKKQNGYYILNFLLKNLIKKINNFTFY